MGESLSIGENIYTEAGNYIDTLLSIDGCDSIVSTTLSFYPQANASFTEVACDSFEWNGTTYTESGVYTYTVPTNAVGCDSTATLNLTINNEFKFNIL